MRKRSSSRKKSTSRGKILTVIPDKGEYQTIQEAIDAAPPNSKIIVHPGLYRDNLTITTPGLKICASDPKDRILVVVNENPSILIKLKIGETCTLENLKISHSGEGVKWGNKKQNQLQKLGEIFG